MSDNNTEVHNLRVKTYFPRVKDFERKENGDIIRDSLKGPEIIEARQQLSRERIVAGAEMKILQEQIRWYVQRKSRIKYLLHVRDVCYYFMCYLGDISSLVSFPFVWYPHFVSILTSNYPFSDNSSQCYRCYHKEGVNHYENCKDLVEAYAEKLKSPYFGMIRVSFSSQP